MADWAKHKVVDLKAELKRRDLSQNGLKAELVARLVEADQAEAASGAGNTEDENDDEDAQSASAESTGKDDLGKHDDGASSDTISVQTTSEIKPSLDQDEEVQKSDPNNKDTEAPKGSVLSEEQPDDAPEATAEVTAPFAIEQESGTLSQETPVSEEKPATGEQHDEMNVVSETADEPMQVSSTDQPLVSEQESQKRKRRSATPPPDAEAVAKRARIHEGSPDNTPAGVEISKENESEKPGEKTLVESMEGVQTQSQLEQPIGGTAANKIDYERAVSPSVHPATTALYISNLMRPLRLAAIQTHLVDLATPAGQALNHDIIAKFHLDQVRSHAFVVFDSLSAASRVRNLLHDCIWPNESNRKALWVDFVPPEKVQGWIDKETDHGGRSTRWEVVYSDDANGNTEARLEIASATAPKAGPPPPVQPSAAGRFAPTVPADIPSNIPVGPRSQRELGNPPTGPRSKRSGPGPRPPPGPMAGGFGGIFDAKRTQTEPIIGYTPVPNELARRRLNNMRGFYRPDADPRDLGREFNRYSFENGDGFVDRGKEVFEGIRPPHRERERAMRGGPRGGGGFGGRRRGGGGGGVGAGGPPHRRGGDRYLPGGGRDDRAPRRDYRS